ncbi:MAG: ferritin [Phycisphaerae bacterium]|nr:ferritin [Phycisphaerae bacterium]
MIGKRMEKALNDQIKAELDSAYLYLSMAACFHAAGLDGMAKWMRIQAKEEEEHAMKLFDHIVERDGRALVPEVAKPKQDWKSPLEAFKEAYKHEQKVTSLIHSLVKLAGEENDYPAGIMLQWFVTEQVEEEANASKIVQTLERIGDSGNGLIMLDHRLGERED